MLNIGRASPSSSFLSASSLLSSLSSPLGLGVVALSVIGMLVSSGGEESSIMSNIVRRTPSSSFPSASSLSSSLSSSSSSSLSSSSYRVPPQSILVRHTNSIAADPTRSNICLALYERRDYVRNLLPAALSIHYKDDCLTISIYLYMM